MTEGTIRIRIGAREHDKPYDPACPVCTSPVLLQVDTLLSYGWTYKRVQEYMRSMRPAGVRQVSVGALRGHVAHLAAPHAQARVQLEEAVAARGASALDGSPPVTPADLATLALQRAYETLADGGGETSVRDAVTILKLQRDIERDEAGRELAGTVEQWQAAVRELLWIARKHLGVHWADFAADVRGSEALRSIMPPPREEPAGDSAATAD
jgi:sugar phosphate isomerase/epimerase